jgi:hypothetical protein
MLHKPEPLVLSPFDDQTLTDIRTHVGQVRRCFDWPGMPYHDHGNPPEDLFNRWFWHNLPLLKQVHHGKLTQLASDIFGQPLKPSYCFLSMYGPEGICPPHTDRPQCQFTIDVQLNSDGSWPIYIEDKQFVLTNGQAIAYSGTGQRHFRKAMRLDGDNCTFMDLAFFHFVPTNWQGKLD